ncbi:MAG: hypothetical protein ACOY71_12090 [Gemmatimonadota bacterium]
MTASPPPRARLRFIDLTTAEPDAGRVSTTVALGWDAGMAFVGRAEGTASPSGRLRAAAQACLAALSRAVPDVRFELPGVKAVKAFDGVVVIASLASLDDGGVRVVGSSLASAATPRSAALAVLNASNRLLERGDVRRDRQGQGTA